MDMLRCPCCGNFTIINVEHGNYQVCPVCYWENDPVQRRDPEFAGGSNKVSLVEARKNNKKIGACDPSVVKYTREPQPWELPEEEES